MVVLGGHPLHHGAALGGGHLGETLDQCKLTTFFVGALLVVDAAGIRTLRM